MKATLYNHATNDQLDIDTRYKLLRRLMTISKYERLIGMKKKGATKIRQVKLPENVTPEIATYIKGHYGKMQRSKLAQKVGLSKVDLNNAVIALGLSKERMENHAEGDTERSA